MRFRTSLLTIAWLAMPVAAAGQTTATPPGPTVGQSQTTGWLDFGARSTSTTGEPSRYERYRDLRDGAFLQTFRFERGSGNWFLGAAADNAGRRDQRFAASLSRPGRLKVWGQWDQIPMLLSRSTLTMYVEDIGEAPRVLTIPDAIQLQMQTAASAARPGIFAANNFMFDSRSFRHTGSAGVEYIATPELTLRANMASTRREGTLPYGGSFGHSSLVELPAPIRHRLNDFDTSAEYVRGNLLLRGGVTGSWFTNEATAVEFDNPFRATDIAGTPSRGRLSLAPSNSYITGNATASLKLPWKSRATAYVSYGMLKDAGDPLMPQTINTIAPNLAALPRSLVGGEARTTGVNLSFTSRPTTMLDVSARYRFYNYDNLTPEFILPQRVAYDNTPGAATYSTLGGQVSPLIVETEPFGVRRNELDVEARVRPWRIGAAAVGFTTLGEHRSHRFFETTRENVVRVTWDLTTFSMFSVRAKYEHGRRRADVTDDARRGLFNIGEQPELRNYDIAQRDRNRVTVLGSLQPTGWLSLNASVAAGRDDYFESRFGLRDNKHRVYSAGVDLVPTERVTFGASYSFERYDTLQHSRQVSSPPSGGAAMTFEQFMTLFMASSPTHAVVDSRYDWAASGADRVHSVVANLDLVAIPDKLDIRLTYDYNRARALYAYVVGANIPLRTLPDDIDPTLTALPPPTALPLVRSELGRATFDAVYSFNRRVGVGFTYWYEDYKVADFTLDVDANPELARGSSLLLGYLYRPYTAGTAWARLILRW
jgi:MtrB/PioB family decaheme-associated outer membrane protein